MQSNNATINFKSNQAYRGDDGRYYRHMNITI